MGTRVVSYLALGDGAHQFMQLFQVQNIVLMFCHHEGMVDRVDRVFASEEDATTYVNRCSEGRFGWEIAHDEKEWDANPWMSTMIGGTMLEDLVYQGHLPEYNFEWAQRYAVAEKIGDYVEMVRAVRNNLI